MVVQVVLNSHNVTSGTHCEILTVDWLVVYVSSKSTAMVMAGRPVHLNTIFPGQA